VDESATAAVENLNLQSLFLKRLKSTAQRQELNGTKIRFLRAKSKKDAPPFWGLAILRIGIFLTGSVYSYGTGETRMPLIPVARKAIFDKLKSALEQQCPPMVCSKDKAGVYEIIGNKPVPYGSTKKVVPGMYFASAVARKDMVSFYFMPIYYHRELFAPVAPSLLKSLKGKACFNFRKVEQVDEKELKALLDRGVKAWRKMKYVE